MDLFLVDYEELLTVEGLAGEMVPLRLGNYLKDHTSFGILFFEGVRDHLENFASESSPSSILVVLLYPLV